MTILVYSVVFAVAMIIITKAPVAYAMMRQFGRYDNKEPRIQEAQLSGFGQRAMSAHNNSIEAFPIFAAGALFAAISQPESEAVFNLCIAFIIARVLYTLCYWLNWDKFRSLFWGVGIACSIGLMLVAIPNSDALVM